MKDCNPNEIPPKLCGNFVAKGIKSAISIQASNHSFTLIRFIVILVTIVSRDKAEMIQIKCNSIAKIACIYIQQSIVKEGFRNMLVGFRQTNNSKPVFRLIAAILLPN